MKFSRLITAIDSHTAGEAARLIIGGVLKFPGKTMAEKKEYLEKHEDTLRKAVMLEPRGHHDMFGAFLCEPVHEEADYGIIFMDTGGYLNMCGHNTIAAMTAAVECGWVPVEDGQKEVKVVQEAPAGLVYGTVHMRDNHEVESVSFENVPSFLYKENVEVHVPSLGKSIHCDISFGGSFFAIFPATEVGLDICPTNAGKLSKIGMEILHEVNEQVKVQHPTLAHIHTVDLVEMYGPPKSPDATFQNVVVFGAGCVDRSPCGTGTSAKIATLYAKGELKEGEHIIYESISGTKFKGKIARAVTLEGYEGYKTIIPEITGSAAITGINTFLVDPKDPLKDGFLLD